MKLFNVCANKLSLSFGSKKCNLKQTSEATYISDKRTAKFNESMYMPKSGGR